MFGVVAWWNLIFLMAFPVSIFFLLKYLLGNKFRRKDDPPQESHVGASFDAEHHFDHDLVDKISIVGKTETASLLSYRLFLEFLEESRIPRMLLAAIFFCLWGFTGWLANQFLNRLLGDPLVFLWLSMVLAFLLSIFLTRFTSRIIGRHTTLSERYVRQGEELIGCEGGAIDKITLERGMAQICDRQGNLHRIYCRIDPRGEIIQEGDQVLIVDYDRGENRYVVKQSPLSAS